MTNPKIERIGVVTHYSTQGDWAFFTAFRIAESLAAHLNVYHFTQSPYESPQDLPPELAPIHDNSKQALIAAERILRERYDEELGDYIDVGFRLCDDGRHNRELRRCLKRKEYQLLVLPYTEYGATFGNMPIEEFAYRFISPVMLVGPERSQQLHLNASALMLLGALKLHECVIQSIQRPSKLQALPVI